MQIPAFQPHDMTMILGIILNITYQHMKDGLAI